MMYKVGIIGHGPEHLHPIEDVRRSISHVLDLLYFQYGGQLVYNIIGDIGVGLTSMEECLDSVTQMPYNVFLPYTLEKTTQHWFPDQKEKLNWCYGYARGIFICDASGDRNDKSYERLIEDSNFIVAFWIGKKQGKTFDAIKYSLKNNKLVLNGFDDLRLITNVDLKRKIY